MSSVLKNSYNSYQFPESFFVANYLPISKIGIKLLRNHVGDTVSVIFTSTLIFHSHSLRFYYLFVLYSLGLTLD